jgi:hypothetical protein
MKRIIILLIFLTACTAEETLNIRKSAVSGSWYPGDNATIEKELSQYLANAKDYSLDDVDALIVPHAGWRFSGQVAAAGFRQLKDDYDTVILIGPSHQASYRGASISNATHYETPVGLMRISDKANELLKEELFLSHPTAHLKEHDLEIELPFLQHTLSNFEIIPVLIGSQTTLQDAVQIAGILDNFIEIA